MADTHQTASSPSKKNSRRAPRIALVMFLGLLVLLVIGGLVVHAKASNAYRQSFDKAMSLAQRNDAAALAHKLEPWDSAYATRAIVMQKWLHGSILLRQDAALPAMLELADAYRLDVGDQELLALFKDAQVQLNLDSNFKAHIQHGHEGPGGTLRPQDLMP